MPRPVPKKSAREKNKEAFTDPEQLALEEAAKPKTELDLFLASVEKDLGPATIRQASTIPPFPSISTGIFTLDFALLGGIPETLVSLVYGNESAGKTTICNRIIASSQRKHDDKTAAMIDMEGTYDTIWGKYHGVDREKLLVVNPTCGEEAVDLLIGLIETWEIGLIVTDSIALMTPAKIIEDSAADQNVSPLARLMGICGSKVTMALNKERKRGHTVTVIFTNQWRSKIGVMFGDPRTLPGGRSINDYVPMTKIEVRQKDKMGTDAQGVEALHETEHSFKLWKTKAGMSIKAGEFQMSVNVDHPLGPGRILDAGIVAVYARKMGLLTGSGGAGWIIEDVDSKFKKLEEIESFLYNEPAEMLRLQQRIIAQQRVLTGLSAIPKDGYLLDWNAPQNVISTGLLALQQESLPG